MSSLILSFQKNLKQTSRPTQMESTILCQSHLSLASEGKYLQAFSPENDFFLTNLLFPP